MAIPPAASLPASAGLKFGFSTLGCPELNPQALRALAARHGSRFVEIRALNGSLDFVAELARFPGGAAGMRDFLLEAGVRVRLVASSFLLTRSPAAQRALLTAEAEAGEALGAQWLRVFGGGDWGDPLTPEGAATARAHREWWQALRAARGWSIDLIFEVHDAFSSSASVLAFCEQTGGPMPLLWDTHHTWKVGGETPGYAWSQLGPHVRHAHLKDSITEPGPAPSYRYVAPGSGEFPVQEVLTLLATAGFDGVVALEWEKVWHPSLPALETVLPAWQRAIAAFDRPTAPARPGTPSLLFRCDFDQAQIVPSAGPYFHGAREQYEDIVAAGPTACPPSLGTPTPSHPRLGRFRIYYEGGDRSQRIAQILAEDAPPQRRFLRFSLREPNVTIDWPEGPQHKSRIQTELYGNVELREFYQTVRLRLSPAAAQLRDYPAEIKWFTVMEFWNQAGWTDEPFPFRFGLHLIKPDPGPGTELIFAAGAQAQVDANTYRDIWHHANPALAVPFGVWLTVEIYFREGDASTGRFYAAVAPDGGRRSVLFDVRNWTHHPANPAPSGMKQFSPLKLYTSAELVDYLKAAGSALEVDWAELELWTGRTPENSPEQRRAAAAPGANPQKLIVA